MRTHAFLPLLLLLLLFSGANYFWLSYDTVPPNWDSSVHLLSAAGYHTVLASITESSDFSATALLRALKEMVRVDRGVYPPLFPLAASFIPFLGTSSADSLIMANCLFAAILALALHQIGRKIHSEATGVLSAVIILLYPAVVGFSRMFMLDLALLAMTALSFYLLLYSERFSNATYTFLFGVSFGLGLLTKPTFLTFISMPLIYMVCLMALETPLS